MLQRKILFFRENSVSGEGYSHVLRLRLSGKRNTLPPTPRPLYPTQCWPHCCWNGDAPVLKSWNFILLLKHVGMRFGRQQCWLYFDTRWLFISQCAVWRVLAVWSYCEFTPSGMNASLNQGQIQEYSNCSAKQSFGYFRPRVLKSKFFFLFVSRHLSCITVHRYTHRRALPNRGNWKRKYGQGSGPIFVSGSPPPNTFVKPALVATVARCSGCHNAAVA